MTMGVNMTNWPCSDYSKINIEATKHCPFREADCASLRQSQKSKMQSTRDINTSSFKLEQARKICNRYNAGFNVWYFIHTDGHKTAPEKYINDFESLASNRSREEATSDAESMNKQGIDLTCDNEDESLKVIHANV